jgi:predicted nucleic acid-binding protein
MPEIIISDTSCLIILDKVGLSDLLSKLYTQVYVTPIVAKEFGNKLPEGIIIKEPIDLNLFKALSQVIDQGEASSFALAFEVENSILVLDDRKARAVATTLNLKFTGTLGILLKAKKGGILPSLQSVMDALAKTDFRISQNVIDRILKEAGEI